MHECRKCEQFGLQFARAYSPQEYIEGNRQSRIWIVGLNPAPDPSWVEGNDTRTALELQAYFDDPKKVHPYFKNFRAVSTTVFNALGTIGGTAHTDLVKCPSKGWPPNGVSESDTEKIIENCQTHLLAQIRQIRPTMIICNGIAVCTAMKKIFPPPSDCPQEVTSYITQVEGQNICIILSGFIKYIDNYAKRRLGIEIESRLKELSL